MRNDSSLLASDYRLVDQIPEGGKTGHPFFVSNGFARMPSGSLIAASPLLLASFPNDIRTVSGREIRVYRSGDRGESWGQVSCLPLEHPAEVTLFVHEGRLYLFKIPIFLVGPGIVLGCVSEDEGRSWSEWIRVIEGPMAWLTSHQLATVVQDGRLYWIASERMVDLVALCCELRLGLLNPAAWRVSAPSVMPIPPELCAGTVPVNPKMRCLEGNVLRVDGTLRVLARAHVPGTPGMAAVFDLQDDGKDLRLSFRQFHPLPGGQCKFYIVQDESTGLFWMASNLPAEPRKGNDRRHLLLWYGCDGLNWFPAGWIAKAKKVSQSFMYPSLIIAGDDLMVLSRTALESGHFHDADALTFHVVRNFRSLDRNVWFRE